MTRHPGDWGRERVRPTWSSSEASTAVDNAHVRQEPKRRALPLKSGDTHRSKRGPISTPQKRNLRGTIGSFGASPRLLLPVWSEVLILLRPGYTVVHRLRNFPHAPFYWISVPHLHYKFGRFWHLLEHSCLLGLLICQWLLGGHLAMILPGSCEMSVTASYSGTSFLTTPITTPSMSLAVTVRPPGQPASRILHFLPSLPWSWFSLLSLGIWGPKLILSHG